MINKVISNHMKENLSPDYIGELMEKEYGYYSDSLIQSRTFSGLLNFIREDVNSAQDIYSLCLEGPPGVGKTMFAKVYSKLVSEIFNEEVYLVDFTCTKDTGKTELIEEINVMAVVEQKANMINIPGKIIQAIKLVNEGKRVILFIDEYDKARRETDSFFNSFLQSGSLNAVQHGDLFILDEFKNNIQVLFCKNDPDIELSEAMQRRVRIIRLDYITPERFLAIANRLLYEGREERRRVDRGILDLVVRIYEKCYELKDAGLFSRLPATSELLIAIEEASDLLHKGNISKAVLYRILLEDIFKDTDNQLAFEDLISSNESKDKFPGADILLSMKNAKDKESYNNGESLSDMLGKAYFSNQNIEFAKKEAELEAKDKLYKEKILEAQNVLKKYLEKEKDLKRRTSGTYQGPSQIEVNGLTFDLPGDNECLPNFQDESAYVKRGQSVFGKDPSKQWFNIAKITSKVKFNMYLIENVIKNSAKFGIYSYENGFQLVSNRKDANIKIAMTRSEDKNGNYDCIIWSDSLVIPPSSLENVMQAFAIIESLYKESIKTNPSQQNNIPELECSIDCLIYNDEYIDGLEKTSDDNVYLLSTNDFKNLPKIAKAENISSIESLKAVARDIVYRAANQGKPKTLSM